MVFKRYSSARTLGWVAPGCAVSVGYVDGQTPITPQTLTRRFSPLARHPIPVHSFFISPSPSSDFLANLIKMAAPPRPVPPYLRLRTPGFAHHGLKFSPYFDGRAAIASGANFGLVGNGRVHIVQTTPAGLQLQNV